MTKKDSKQEYRKYYKDYFGIDFDSSYDVHHIDFNRQNNDIENLLLLPHSLHNKYHRSLPYIKAGWNRIYPDISAIPGYGLPFEVEMLKDHVDAVIEMQVYIRHRELGYPDPVDGIIKKG